MFTFPNQIIALKWLMNSTKKKNRLEEPEFTKAPIL